MTLHLEIEMNNSAFGHPYSYEWTTEAARILRSAADTIEHNDFWKETEESFCLWDIKQNKVGRVTVNPKKVSKQ